MDIRHTSKPNNSCDTRILYNDEVTTLPSVLTVGVGPVTIFNNGKYIQGLWRRNDITDPFNL